MKKEQEILEKKMKKQQEIDEKARLIEIEKLAKVANAYDKVGVTIDESEIEKIINYNKSKIEGYVDYIPPTIEIEEHTKDDYIER